MSFKWNPDMRLRILSSPCLPPAFFFVLAACSALGYLGLSYLGGFLGFPLDDAWIHQTYACNLAQLHQFAFVPGQASAGSTSLLWTLLVAVGYLFNFNYLAWTYVLGASLLGLNAWLTYRLVLTLWPERPLAAWVAGGCVALEWHLAWAAVSGMETLLFSALILAIFVIPPERAGWLGVCVGLSVLARPDGLIVLPLAMARMFFPHLPKASRLAFCTLSFVVGFALLFLPYLAFNYGLAGAVWPNTFYAKQAEYAPLRQMPVWTRIGSVLLQPLFVGAQALLLPGIAVAAWEWARQRRWSAWLPLGWAAAFLAAYILRLPAYYQHGRYFMPVIPILVAIGVGGTARWLRLRPPAENGRGSVSFPRLISRAWAMAFALVGLAFWGLGAKSFQADVQLIESEMVQTAKWINQNTPSSALIAAHDIGALGYFGQRRILDMAGLISPEVIPLMGHDVLLKEWIIASRADYLVIAPGWDFPGVVSSLEVSEVYSTNAPYSPAAGGENMVVYRLRGAP
jgi:arabinofuranosyltransferase